MRPYMQPAAGNRVSLRSQPTRSLTVAAYPLPYGRGSENDNPRGARNKYARQESNLQPAD